MGFFRPRVIYQLTRKETGWLATQTGDSFPAIDVASGAGGRDIIRNLTSTNAKYASAVSRFSAGYSIVEGLRTFGRCLISERAINFKLSIRSPILAQACARDIHLSCSHGDNSNDVATASAGFMFLDVEKVPAARFRGAPGKMRGTVIGGITTVGGIGRLRFRSVYCSPSNGALLSYAGGFTEIDSGHTSEFSDANPPISGPGGYFEFGGTYRHLGAEPGDAVTVTHALNNTRLQFGGYVTARDTVKLFVRDPNPAGAAIDLPPGTIRITSRRLRG